MIKVIGFDFDGVIVDSEGGKLEAWINLFDDSEFEGRAKLIVPEILSRCGSQTRFNILREIFAKLGQPEAEIEDLVGLYADRFSQRVRESILNKGVNSETKEALKSLLKNRGLFIVSNTPDKPLLESVKDLGIAEFFEGIFGRPENSSDVTEAKAANLEAIRRMENVLPGEMVYIGNEETDLLSAQKFGCPFIGFVGFEKDKSKWSGCNFPVIESFGSLEAVAESL